MPRVRDIMTRQRVIRSVMTPCCFVSTRAARAGGARYVLRTVVLDELAIVNGERQHVAVARYGTHFVAVVVYCA